MNMRIFFVDEYSSSRQNGIGTYRDILLQSLHQMYGVNLSLISLNSDRETLAIAEYDYGYEYSLPAVGQGNWRVNGNIIWPLLSLYIADSAGNIFIFNHSPSAAFIQAMKDQFPLSKTAFIIHDQGWCASLLGQRHLLDKIMKHKTLDIPTHRVEDYCKKELDIYSEVDKVVCLSESAEKILSNIYKVSRSKVVRIENGLPSKTGKTDKTRTRKLLGLRNEEKVLLFVGRAAYHKGSVALLQAVSILRRRNIIVRCVFAGNIHGFADHLASYKDIAAHVTLTGQLTKRELKHWYAAADIGVLSSYTEQCSYAALEMMNAGIPIVSSDGNGLCDMFTNGKNAFVAHIPGIRYTNAYAKNLANSIEFALKASTEKKKQYIDYNRRLLTSKYSVNRMVEQYMNLFRELTNNTKYCSS